jgi:predicted O-linked N-acetylglucosamine transferase (SPINDLY family)
LRCLTTNYFGTGREEEFSYHRVFGDQFAQAPVTHTPEQHSKHNGKLRIGYVSPDFSTHSVAYFFEPLLQHHNKDNVEVFCYYNRPKVDQTTKRLMHNADHWRSIVGLNDDQLVQLIQNDGINILVDLAGHTGKNSLTAFAYKPAPIQVTWLGYPNTTGLDAIDYRFTDDIADPVGDSEAFHSETLVRLPHGMWCYNGDTSVQPQTQLPYDRNDYITFGSFNNLAKVTPQVLDLWADILKAVPHSKLLLKAKQLSEDEAQQRFIELFEARGIGRDRLDLHAFSKSKADHLALYGEIDIALDAFPFNGATTTCEALWMGVPVLTLRGDRHVARVGASLLHRVGLDDFVAENEEDYLARATALCQDLDHLRTLRQSMRARVEQSPLCNGPEFAANIERAFQNMWQTFQQDANERQAS